MSVKPYGTGGSKKQEVRQMFDNIAPTYDFLNHALSLNIDKIWRRKAINSLRSINPKKILDIATGTGDLAIAALKLGPDSVIGVDISEGMIRVGQQKVEAKGLQRVISFQTADSEELPFDDCQFDALTVAFGVRNFENPQKGLAEMCRVLKPRGRLVVLEFMMPRSFPFKQLYQLYFQKILPLIGKVISKDFSAYQYLPDSVQKFPQGEDFVQMLKEAGFDKASFKSLSFGIAGLYIGDLT
ncbi:MAG: bifunctional demethylmenaquinone methyltransferase/2-methoxy-6-polyprenyl-1,4-benzoquinol methylase UbiE [Bacteroidales bacterium]|nr:bifunctional demethylmenaquinone methyltransferase/2-methoxy-6-polyprenyl-1,4-benzoquinol methylase UbiE [Bacteroidales bacterium]